jgi:S-adenosylmethionine:tRNA ribosyltransferase-isomerase
VQIETITLHVGLGTFQPVRAERLEDIHLHAERYTLPQATAKAINTALQEGNRIIAVGTTVTRTLEHCAHIAPGEPLKAHSGQTSIFLSPGHKFQIVSGLLTNFHLPKSTLLMLVSAFADREMVLDAYAHAVRQKYSFFSYGDCMLLL